MSAPLSRVEFNTIIYEVEQLVPTRANDYSFDVLRAMDGNEARARLDALLKSARRLFLVRREAALKAQSAGES